MSFRFTCPHCGTRTEVDDAFAGLSGHCVTCGKPITLPKLAAAAAAGTADSNRTGRVATGRVATGRVATGQRSMAVAAAAVGGLMLFLGTAGYFVIRYAGRAMATLQGSHAQLLSSGNLKRIADGLEAYAFQHGTYPPAYTVDPLGRPLHSWRVLILPFLDQTELYQRIELTLPWDHPINSSLHFEMPLVYRDPRNAAATAFTNYVVATGPTSLFPIDKPPMKPSDVTDQPGKTILVMELINSVEPTNWMSPTDFQSERLEDGDDWFWMLFKETPASGLRVITVDKQVHTIATGTATSAIHALITPSGGEPLPDDVWDGSP